MSSEKIVLRLLRGFPKEPVSKALVVQRLRIRFAAERVSMPVIMKIVNLNVNLTSVTDFLYCPLLLKMFLVSLQDCCIS